MATHMIPRNTKGEGRLLFIFSTKALIYTVLGGVIGFLFYYLFKMFKLGFVGIVIMAILAILGFCIGTFKIPNSDGLKITRLIGGENLDDIILRYIKFKKNKNKIYITKEEEI